MLKYLLDGGFIMLPLLGLSIVGLAVIIDRLRVFRLASESDAESLFHKVTDCIDRGDLEAAIKACHDAKGPIAAVFYVGLHKYRALLKLGQDKAELENNLTKTIGEYAPHVIESLEKRLNLLVMVASVSPLLGMTGTVTGMIRSFDSMSQMGGLQGGAVAGGISEALITTATGLIIAIPSVIAYNIFSRRVRYFTLQIEEKASDLIEYIRLYGANRKAS